MFRLVFQILLFFASSAFSQSIQNVYPNFLGSELGAVLKNSDWKVLCEARGYLNDDTAWDLALILESSKELNFKSCEKCKVTSVKPRMIVVVINNLVVVQNNSFIARGDEGGMLPYLEPNISIRNKKLNIFWQYTRGNTSYFFEFKKDKMVLINAKKVDVHAATGDYESYSFDFINRTIESEKGNISKVESKIEIFKIKKLKRLKRLSDLVAMYDWEVIPNVFL